PRVMRIPEGVPVQVDGCVDDFTWCDVSLGPDRGWVYAGNLEYPYRDGRRIVILDNGPRLGFPIVTFSVGPYWDTYYRGRPWYSRRSYWAGRSPSIHWGAPSGVRPYVGRPEVVRPGVVRPGRPGVIRPGRPEVIRPGRPEVIRPGRPEVIRPGRPEVIRPGRPEV